MDGTSAYEKISDKDFIKLLEKSADDLKKWNYKLYQENQYLKEEVEELKLILGMRQKRGLISKFDKEFDEEDKKKNPNRDYASITPDAEEVYKRYYELKEQLQHKYDDFPKTVKNLSKEQLESLYLDLLHAENEKSQQLKKYEDPEDMTLMFMWCGEQAKDKIKELQKTIEDAIKYIGEHIRIDDEYPSYMEMLIEERDELLNILNRRNEKND